MHLLNFQENSPAARSLRPVILCDMLLFMWLRWGGCARAGSKDGYHEPSRIPQALCCRGAVCRRVVSGRKAFLDWLTRQRGRTRTGCDAARRLRRPMTSEPWPHGSAQSRRVQHVVFAVGPADGWSKETRRSLAPRQPALAGTHDPGAPARPPGNGRATLPCMTILRAIRTIQDTENMNAMNSGLPAKA